MQALQSRGAQFLSCHTALEEQVRVTQTSPIRVHAVEAAIFNRLQELAQASENTDHKVEEQAIAEALRTQRVLKRDKLQFPDWETK